MLSQLIAHLGMPAKRSETVSNLQPTLALTQQFKSEREIAPIIGISHRTLQKWRLYGRGPRYYKVCGSVKYNVNEVLQWVESQAAGGGQAA